MKLKIVPIQKNDTKSIEDGIFIWVPRKQKITRDWFMGFQAAFIELAKDPDIVGAPRRVLDFLFGRLDFENFLQVAQKDIAIELNITRPMVSRAMKLLVSKGVILKQGDSHIAAYRLNEFYGWKGKVKNMPKLGRHLELVK